MAEPGATVHRRSRIGLRGRLVLAFLTLAVLIAVSGGAGLFFVGRIGGSVTILADTATPLLQQSSLLMANARRMQQAFRDAVAASDPAASRAQLADLAREAEAGLAELRLLAERGETGLDIAASAKAQIALLQQTAEAIDQDVRFDEAAARAAERFARFEAARAALQTLLGETSNAFEQRMVAAEETGKVQVQTGQASLESLDTLFTETMTEVFPALQGAYRLTRDVTRLEELAKAARSASTPTELDKVQQAAQRTLKSSAGAAQRLAGRMRSEAARAQLAAMRDGLSTLQSTLDGDAGLFAAQRQVLEASASLDSAQRAMAEAETRYLADLAEAGVAAERLEQTARGLAQHATYEARIGVAAVVAVGTGLAVLLGLLVAARLTRPLGQLTTTMRALASGTLPEVPCLNRADEIGAMASSVQVFRDNAVEMARLQQEQVALHNRTETEKRVALTAMAQRIETATGDALDEIGRHATTMATMSGEMRGSATRTDMAARGAVEAAAQVLTSAETVATAAETMTSAINAISDQVQRAGAVVASAVAAGSETRTSIEALGEQVAKIGSVADVIGEIAARTNLLALNATIEAARAGDAGKGFAVVAAEVKGLANQTASSTEEIAHQILAVRDAAGAAVAAVGRIEQTIREVNAISDAIAEAVGQQGTATSDIARHIAQTTVAANDMNQRNIEVSTEAGQTERRADMVTASTEALGSAVIELRRSVIRAVRTSTSEVDRRLQQRVAADLPCRLRLGNALEPAIVVDLSQGGAMLRDAPPLAVGARAALRLDQLNGELPFEVRAAEGQTLHVAFAVEEANAAGLVALLQRLQGIGPAAAAQGGNGAEVARAA